jgi:hypothetical protein
VPPAAFCSFCCNIFCCCSICCCSMRRQGEARKALPLRLCLIRKANSRCIPLGLGGSGWLFPRGWRCGHVAVHHAAGIKVATALGVPLLCGTADPRYHGMSCPVSALCGCVQVLHHLLGIEARCCIVEQCHVVARLSSMVSHRFAPQRCRGFAPWYRTFV